MQKSKQTYVAPEMAVIEDVYEGAICTYSLIYPGEGGPNPPAARGGYYDGQNGLPSDTRYGKSHTQIWN